MSCFIFINWVMHGWGPHINIISLFSLCFSLSCKCKCECSVCFSDACGFILTCLLFHSLNFWFSLNFHIFGWCFSYGFTNYFMCQCVGGIL